MLTELNKCGATKYFVAGRETGERGTKHLQGYVMFRNQIEFTALKKIPRVHWERRRGTHKQAIDYCKKGEGTPDAPVNPSVVEWGEEPKQGARSDIAAATEMIDAGETMRDVALANPAAYVRYHRGLMSYRLMTTEAYSGERHVTWIHGPSHSGKSMEGIRLAKETGKPFFVKKGNSKWFDGYDQQEVVIFDEFRIGDARLGQIDFIELLNLLGTLQHRVETKGAMMNWQAKTIIITSIAHWNDGSDRGESVVQLSRRITEEVEVGAPKPAAVRQPKKRRIEGWQGE